jgi:hypothetical protein
MKGENMKKLAKAGLIMFFAITATSAFAQSGEGKLKMKLNYNIGLPLGSFKSDFISNSSFNGGNGEIGYWFNPSIGLGLNVGYQNYYQKYGRQTYKVDNGETISAVLSNTIESIPVLINGTFAPLAKTAAKIQPYVSVGAGVDMVNYRQYYGEFSSGNSSTSFAAQAGAGFMVPLGTKLNKASLQVGGTFNYVSYKENGLSNLNNAGVNAGVIFPIK